jgi:hypothetical protein
MESARDHEADAAFSSVLRERIEALAESACRSFTAG